MFILSYTIIITYKLKAKFTTGEFDIVSHYIR